MVASCSNHLKGERGWLLYNGFVGAFLLVESLIKRLETITIFRIFSWEDFHSQIADGFLQEEDKFLFKFKISFRKYNFKFVCTLCWQLHLEFQSTRSNVCGFAAFKKFSKNNLNFEGFSNVKIIKFRIEELFEPELYLKSRFFYKFYQRTKLII